MYNFRNIFFHLEEFYKITPVNQKVDSWFRRLNSWAKKKQFQYKFVLIMTLFLGCTTNIDSRADIYIRINQVGFEPSAIKSAVVLSDSDLSNNYYEIIDNKTFKVIIKGKIERSTGKYAAFPYSYRINFNSLTEKGTYKIKINGVYSYSFKVEKNVYSGIPAKLLTFFTVQRCGYTNPFMHEICHKADATSLIENGITINKSVDVTGGWHDAGDYVKIINTTAYATYSLLFAYELNKSKFQFDNNNNQIPDLLEEAKIGLDWLLRCNFEKFKLITQVQDLRDHSFGWRLPEKDTLEFDRPAFVGMGKNIIGIYAATMSLASRIWREKFHFDEYADKCLNSAENLYSIHSSVPDIDNSTMGIYQDKSFLGKLSLGAVELYLTTNRAEYLRDAKKYADEAGPEYWWSYGEISDFAFYRLSQYDIKYAEFIEKSLLHFQNQMNLKVFNEAVDFFWGSNNTLLGVALKNILYKKITKRNTFDDLAESQIDYVLGKNPWGISFITDTGTKSAKNLHHQISHILGKKLPGGFAAGPVKKEIVKNYNIQYDSIDRYESFQSDSAYYRDDRMDYITNEPTIIANATGIIVFSGF